jgi:sigma-B regulation protein RsbU (phosphoserine phosphatase)
VGTPLRLVRDEPLTVDLAAAETHLNELQTEIESLRQEVNLLRRRDEMVHFYLHRLDEELRLASRLQQDFLPKELPVQGSVRFHTLFRPAGYVSGDLFDVFRLDDAHVAFYLADAIGHGVPAALLTMFLRTSLVTMEIVHDHYRILTPGETMARLNAALLRQNFSQTTFATAIYGLIDVTSGLASIARAGHPCPILIPSPDAGPQSNIRDLDEGGGSLLGVFPDEEYATVKVQLSPGERLLIHSDGIDSVFGDNMQDYVRPWREELAQLRSADAAKMLGEFSTRLDRQSGSLAPKDDLTIIAMEMVGT